MNKLQKIIPVLLAAGLFLGIFSCSKAEENHVVYLPLVMSGGNNQPVTGLAITTVSDNRGDYQNQQVPTFEKFEITFQVDNSVAKNFQFPYDPTPPPGIDLSNPNYQGITVNAIFTPDDWQTIYTQPAFYFQEFEDEIRRDQAWYYPTGNFSWKVRFAPDQPGNWQYKLTAQDASGLVESAPQSFTVATSNNPGFVRVSESDSRYFEFDNGDYFSGLGYNLNYNQIDWINPVLSNQGDFETMSENGIQLFRIWLSQWSIYGSAWNPWYSPDPAKHAQYIPIPGLVNWEAYAGNEVSMMLAWGSNWYSPCMFIGNWKAAPAVIANHDYRLQIRYKLSDLQGPRDASQPFGFVAKSGGWLWDPEYCYNSGTGEVLAATYPGENWRTYPDPVDSTWTILEGEFNVGNRDFLPLFYLALENVSGGRAYVDHVSIEEILGNDAYGPNIVSKPSMAHHLYFEQRNSYAFDQVLDLAAEYGIYLRPVIMEKNEWISNQIGADGSFTDESVNNFYGEWREVTKGRWLQQAWWRYLQARWGYSTQIHSWELLNEGDPASTRHYALADEFGKYMKCRVFDVAVSSQSGATCAYEHPNAHMVSTSFWASFPGENFWASPDYPNIDYADVHAYISTGWLHNPEHENDASAYHIDYGRDVRLRLNAQTGDSGTKPIIRGEAGLDYVNQQIEQPELQADTQGVWLHNYVWSSLDANGLIEEYWWTHNLNTQPGPNGDPGLYEIFGYFSDFMQGIPLNNGSYANIEATANNPQLLIYGQKDVAHNQAHLWVKNQNYTWRNIVNAVPNITGIAGNVTLTGFQPNTSFTVTWYEFTSQGLPNIHNSTVASNNLGEIILALPNDPQVSDVGIRIGN